jgi:hypothetical protein
MVDNVTPERQPNPPTQRQGGGGTVDGRGPQDFVRSDNPGWQQRNLGRQLGNQIERLQRESDRGRIPG